MPQKKLSTTAKGFKLWQILTKLITIFMLSFRFRVFRWKIRNLPIVYWALWKVISFNSFISQFSLVLTNVFLKWFLFLIKQDLVVHSDTIHLFYFLVLRILLKKKYMKKSKQNCSRFVLQLMLVLQFNHLRVWSSWSLVELAIKKILCKWVKTAFCVSFI